MHPQPTAERMHPYVWPGAPPAHNWQWLIVVLAPKIKILIGLIFFLTSRELQDVVYLF
jgi:hypothetical protein